MASKEWLCAFLGIGILLLLYLFVPQQSINFSTGTSEFKSMDYGAAFTPNDFAEVLRKKDVRDELLELFKESNENLIAQVTAMEENTVSDLRKELTKGKEIKTKHKEEETNEVPKNSNLAKSMKELEKQFKKFKITEPKNNEALKIEPFTCPQLVNPVEVIPYPDCYRTAAEKLQSQTSWLGKFRNSTLLFLHVHKAGGTEMRLGFVEKKFPKDGYKCEIIESYGHSYAKLSRLSKKNGLTAIGELMQRKPGNYFSFTSLRDPTQRILSQYDFEMRWDGQYGRPKHSNALWNTSPEKHLHNFILNKGKVIDRFMGLNHYTRWFGCERTGCKITQDVFNNALKTLNSLDFILITEWYDDNRTATMLRSFWNMPKLKIRHRAFRHYIRDRGKIKGVDPRIVERLRCLNQWDHRLYDYAKSLSYLRLKTFQEGDKLLDFKDITYKKLLQKEKTWYIVKPLAPD